MKSFVTALALTVALVGATSPLAAAQPAAGVDCADIVPTTTTTPSPVVETTVAPVPCEPDATETPTTTAIPTSRATPTTTTATPTTTLPTTTPPSTTSTTSTVPTATPPSARAAAPVAAAASPLDIVVPAAMTGVATIAPGSTWTGTMPMTVLGAGDGGWTSTVSLSNIRGTTTGRTLTPTSATYTAPESACPTEVGGSSPKVTVSLTNQAKIAKTGGASCTTSWTSTVSIGVPATNVVADRYTATLTHSIY